jgi:hypothetical protein
MEAFGTGESYLIETAEGQELSADELGSGLVTNDDGIPDLFVWLPRRLGLLRNENIRVFAGMQRRIRVKTPRRSFAFYVDIVGTSPRTSIKLVDVPTTLLASLHAMQGIAGEAAGIFTEDFLSDSRRSVVERRETENFRFTIERLVQGHAGWASNLQFEYFDIENGTIVTRREP